MNLREDRFVEHSLGCAFDGNDEHLECSDLRVFEWVSVLHQRELVGSTKYDRKRFAPVLALGRIRSAGQYGCFRQFERQGLMRLHTEQELFSDTCAESFVCEGFEHSETPPILSRTKKLYDTLTPSASATGALDDGKGVL